VLVIFAHAPVASDPGEGAFDDPGQTDNLECALAAFDDAKLAAFGFDESRQLAALVTGICEYRLDCRKDWAQTTEQTSGGLTYWPLRPGWQVSDARESISNRGLRGLLLNFGLLFSLHSRIPANEGLPELVI
jgi:hypothetical protein